jgi:hypothetical protein
MLQLFTIPQARDRVSQMASSQKACYQFEFTRSFTMQPGETGSVQLPMASEGDFEQEEYNISYNGANSSDRPKIRFKAQASGESQSNDYVPLSLISTPGVSNVRFGSRPFWRFYPAKDSLTIEWDARQCTNAIIVDISFKGWIYPNYKANSANP